MVRFLGIAAGVIITVVVMLIIIDVVSTPVPDDASCLLDTDIILPDRCVARCDILFGCPPATTRPYMFFGQQAASCPLACIGL